MPAPVTLSIDDALGLAREHFQSGNFEEVEGFCTKILAVEPGNAQALQLLGLARHLAGSPANALPLLEQAVSLDTNNAQIHYNLGVVLGALRQWPRALESYRRAVSLNPRELLYHLNLGIAAYEEDCLDEALAAYNVVLAATPHNFDLLIAKALALYAGRRFAEALPVYEKALALQPDNPRAHWEIAHALLITRDYKRGWAAYAQRFAASDTSRVWCYPYPFPEWRGEPLAGKTILLHGEQGLGDEFMFASIYPQIIAQAGRVIICSEPRVAPVLRTSFPGVSVIDQPRDNEDAWTRLPASWLAEWQRLNGAIDYQIPNGSLPALTRNNAQSFPDHKGYLKSNPVKVAHWRGNLAHLQRLRVGLCWAANPSVHNAQTSRRAQKKSVPVQALVALQSVRGADFISLQAWDAAHEAAHAPIPLLDCSAGLIDFADTAALIENLDLVLTCDTSVAHLAGAMGKPVWILLHNQAEWRWHAKDDNSPWYPSAKLYRQSALGDWRTVLQSVVADLTRLIE